MERMEVEELGQSLQKRAERLERKQRRFLAGMLVLVAVFLLAGWRTVQPPQENFKTHGLSIVDSRGVVRLILGAPVPNPVEEGKTYERRSPGTGIIFNDAAGNERGGMGMLDPWQHESLLRRCQSRTQLPVFCTQTWQRRCSQRRSRRDKGNSLS
jgi:hypothetical protein